MNKPLIVLGIALLSASAPACGGSGNTAAQSPPATPAAKPPTPVAAPTPGIAPAELRQLCMNYEMPDSRSWKKMLEETRKEDTRWDARFTKLMAAVTLEECRSGIEELEDWIDHRAVAAGALCDWRYRDGGLASAAFDTRARSSREALKRELDAAKLERTPLGCTQKVSSARRYFDAFLALAVTECSPPGDESSAECEQKVQAVCAAYQEGATPKGVAEALACVQRTARSTAATSRAASAGPAGERLPEATSRTPLPGAALQTAILTGAADFFVERAEQELSAFAAEVLADKLCDQESAARPYLPKTCELLKPCEESGEACEPTDPVLGVTPAAIHAAAKTDLDHLPHRVAEALAQKDPNLACAVAFAWGAAHEVTHGAALAAVLGDPQSLLQRPLVRERCEPFEEALLALGRHIQAQLSGNPLVVADALRSGDQDRLVAADESLSSDPGAREAIAEVLRRLAELDAAITGHRQNPSPEARVRLVIAAVQVTVPVMVYLAPDAHDDIYTSVDLIAQVLNRDYATAVVTASNLKVVTFMPPKVRNMLGVAASLAQAESSDDVRRTFEDAALPLGSWRRKNMDRLGATLTGMVGFQAGVEQVLENPASNREVTDGWATSPTLLVGVDLHHGLSKNTRLGLHLNVLDLGALASIRVQEPEVKDTTSNQTVSGPNEVSARATPDVRIEQVFAPGAFLYFGYGPLNLGPTITFVPSLRPAERPNGTIAPLDVLRCGMVVAVDVSVLPLF